MGNDWTQDAEDTIIFSNDEDESSISKLLEVGPVNKTIEDGQQAGILMILRGTADYLRRELDSEDVSWLWMNKMADDIEMYQQTLAGETNSRIQYLKALAAKSMAALSTKFHEIFRGYGKNN
jgi:hypothetical protein